MSSIKKFEVIVYQPQLFLKPKRLTFGSTNEEARSKAKAILAKYPPGSYLDLYFIAPERRIEKFQSTFGKNEDGSITEINKHS